MRGVETLCIQCFLMALRLRRLGDCTRKRWASNCRTHHWIRHWFLRSPTRSYFIFPGDNSAVLCCSRRLRGYWGSAKRFLKSRGFSLQSSRRDCTAMTSAISLVVAASLSKDVLNISDSDSQVFSSWSPRDDTRGDVGHSSGIDGSKFPSSCQDWVVGVYLGGRVDGVAVICSTISEGEEAFGVSLCFGVSIPIISGIPLSKARLEGWGDNFRIGRRTHRWQCCGACSQAIEWVLSEHCRLQHEEVCANIRKRLISQDIQVTPFNRTINLVIWVKAFWYQFIMVKFKFFVPEPDELELCQLQMVVTRRIPIIWKTID